MVALYFDRKYTKNNLFLTQVLLLSAKNVLLYLKIRSFLYLFNKIIKSISLNNRACIRKIHNLEIHFFSLG